MDVRVVMVKMMVILWMMMVMMALMMVMMIECDVFSLTHLSWYG
jgi:hypothetical protein